jgi:hypothetical protein
LLSVSMILARRLDSGWACPPQYAEVSEALLSANPDVPTFFVLDQSGIERGRLNIGCLMRNDMIVKTLFVPVEWGVMVSGVMSSSPKDKG